MNPQQPGWRPGTQPIEFHLQGRLLVTTEDIIQDLQSTAKMINRIPTKSEYRRWGKHNPSTVQRRFASWNNALQSVFGKTHKLSPVKPEIHSCEFCGKPTKNPKYCSKSCSASVNNKVPKREKTAFCHFCGQHTNSTPRSGVRKCRNCFKREKIKQFGEKKIKDFSSTYSRHKYQQIREHAHRVVSLYSLKKVCKICGYDKMADLCHKKSIASFQKSTKLKVVNDIKNLIYLCPNHHWELDHGLLKDVIYT